MQITDIRSRAPKHPHKSLTYRSLWGVRQIVIHHGMTRRGLAGTNLESYLQYHVRTNNWSCGGYPFGVEPDGKIKQAYDMEVQTPHVGNANRHSLGIVLPGDFRYEEPTEIQWKHAVELTLYLLQQLPLKNIKILGHQEVPGYSWKECPAFNMDKFRRDVKRVENGGKIIKEEDEKMTKTQLRPVVSMLEKWTDEKRVRNPLKKSHLKKAKKGDMTSAQATSLLYHAEVRGMR